VIEQHIEVPAHNAGWAGALAVLAGEVDRLRADRDEDRALVDELIAEAAQRGAGANPATVHPTWTDWVDQWLVPRISLSPHRHRWCHHYADHPEVADRLEALWHAWEALWPDPLARLTWFRDGLDHHWPLITAEDGPLRECSARENVHSS
jgi:hypothetical protein